MRNEDSPAEVASRKALEAVYHCLDTGQSFRLEAGAGAGKTYSLVAALKRLIATKSRSYPRRGQQIASLSRRLLPDNELLCASPRHSLPHCLAIAAPTPTVDAMLNAATVW